MVNDLLSGPLVAKWRQQWQTDVNVMVINYERRKELVAGLGG